MRRVRRKKRRDIPVIIGIGILILWAGVVGFFLCGLFKSQTAESKSSAFEEFSASSIFEGQIAEIDYSTEFAKSFKERIERAKEIGVNFAGKYIIMIWDCGASCQTGAVVSAADGRVYELPDVAGCGYKFRKDSKLLIVNSEDCQKEKRYFIWENS